MTTKHSPETWTANGEQITAFDADGFIVPLFERIDATEADMRLAAAAPALRDAARTILREVACGRMPLARDFGALQVVLDSLP
jgi:hypothetical protein